MDFREPDGPPSLGNIAVGSGFLGRVAAGIVFVDADKPTVDLVQHDKPARFPSLF